MTESDVPALISYLLEAWVAGFIMGYILRSFRRGAGMIR